MKKLLLFCFCLITFYAGFSQTIFTENFQSAWTLPTTLSPAWSGTTTPANNVWHMNSYTTGWSGSSGAYSPTGANSTTQSARFHSYDASSGTTGDLISPTIDLSAYTAGTVSLSFYHINTSGTDVVNVYSSNDNGSTWSSALAPSPIGVSSTWTLKMITLPGNSATTKIKFTATSDYGVTDIGIDEVKVFVPVTANGAPINFTATAVTQMSMTIGWTDNSTNETGFRVYRSADGGTTYAQVGSDIPSTTTAGTGATYSQVQTGLIAGVTYYYRIAAFVDLESAYLTGSQATLPPVPMTGIWTIDPAGGKTGTNFITFADAINYLNSNGIGAGGVTFNVAKGATFNETGLSINVTGTSGNPIIFQQSGTGAKPIINFTGTSSTSDFGFKLNGSDYITFDGLDIRDAGTSSSNQMEYAFYLAAASATNGCQYNTVKNCAIDLTKTNTSSRGFYLSSLATAAGGANSYNKFYNNTIQDTYVGYYLYGASAAYDDGNEIGTVSGGTSSITNFNYEGIYINYQTTLKVFSTSIYGSTLAGSLFGIYESSGNNTADIYSNQIYNLTGTSSSSVYGLYIWPGTGLHNIYSNEIYALSNTYSSTGYSAYGIYFYGSGTANVYLNSIHGISSSNGYAYGMYLSSGGTTNIYKNKIYDISTSTISTYYAYGLYVSGGTTNNIYNNFIYDIKAVASTATTPAATGLYLYGGTTDNVFFNSILLKYTATSATNQSAGIYLYSTPTSADLRNNIVVNNVTVGSGASKAVALWRTTTTLTNFSTNSNNNLYYVSGIADAKHLIHYDGTNSDQTLAAYKTRVAPRDAFAVTENPPFVSAVSPYNLHLQIGGPSTQCESGGVTITSPFAITTDIDVPPDTRLNPPDIGADEGAFTPLDITPPTVVYTPLLNTSSLAARSLTYTITDLSGVGTLANVPVLFWKTNAGAYSAAVIPTGTPPSYTYTFGGGAVGDVISYFIVAQDIATPTPNVAATPGAGATVGYNPPSYTVPPTSPNTYTIVPCISGTRTVGATGYYTTLDLAIADLNASELCGSLTLELLDALYTETATLTINYNSGSSAANWVKIVPSGTKATPTISGSVASGPIIKIRNPYTTFDGSNSGKTNTRDLTITNTNVTGPQTILICSSGTVPIVGVTVKNCKIINGATTSSAVVITDVAGAAGYFNNITIQNNSIQLAYIDVYANAAVATGNGSGLLVTGNDLNTSGANASRLVGVYVQGVDGATVSYNNIGNFTSAAAEVARGIWFATGTVNSTISHNTVTNLANTSAGGSGGPMGICVTSSVTGANVLVTDNTISQVTSNMYGDNIESGIYLGGATSGVTIVKNKICNVKNTNSGGYGAYGIVLASSLTVTNTLVANNFISDITGYGYSSIYENGVGINIYTGGGYQVYFNSVKMATDQTSATGSPSCLLVYSTTGSFDIRNNIFDITTTVGTNCYCVYVLGTNAVFSFIDNNDYYTTGPNLGYLGATQATLALWKAATGKDVSSVWGDPLYISDPCDLHIQNTTLSPVYNAGVSLAPTVTVDIDNETRLSSPDIGADEYTFVIPPVLDPTGVSAAVISPTLIDVYFTKNGNGNSVAIAWNTTGIFTAPTLAPPAVGDPFAGGQLLYYGPTSPAAHSCSPQTHYYYKLFSYDGSAYSPGVTANATTPCALVPIPPSYTQGFEGTWPPACWTNTGWVSSLYGAAHTGTKWAYSNLNGSKLTTPGFTLSVNSRLKFWYRVESSGYPQAMKVFASTDGVNFLDELFSISAYTNMVYVEAVIDLSTYTTQNVWLQFNGLSGTGGYDYGICVDDLTMEVIPPCPWPTALTTTNITTTTAQLDWTNGGGETKWDVIYGAPGFDPLLGGTQISNILVHPYTLNPPLSPNTAYDWYVRAECDLKSTPSSWTGPANFTTVQIPATIPFSETFETWPDNWTVLNGTQTNKWFVGPVAVPYAGTNSAYISDDAAGATYNYNGSSLSVVHLYRDITFAGGPAGYTLSFWWKAQGESSFDYMRVYLVDPSTTTPVAGTLLSIGQIGSTYYNLQPAYVNGIITIPYTVTGTQRLVFTWRNDGSVTYEPPASIDDISITAIPTGTLNGTVTDATGVVSGALISCGVYTTNSQIDGTYTMDVPAGTYTVTCAKAGYATGSAPGIIISTGLPTTQDFLLAYQLDPPTNLQAQVQNQYDVYLTWQAPGTLPPNQYIRWDNGVNFDALGSTGANTMIPVIRFTTTDLTPYVGMYLKKIKFYINDAPVAGSVYLKVWVGPYTGTPVVSQAVASVTPYAWNEVTIASPVLITGTSDIYFGYQCGVSANYPAGMDAGPAVVARNYFDWGGTWYENIAAGFSNNWNIAGWVQEGTLAPQQLMPLVQNAQPVIPPANQGLTNKAQNNNSAQFTLSGKHNNQALENSGLQIGNPNVSLNAPLTPVWTVLGYNVYRNGFLLNTSSLVTDLFYYDLALTPGTYNYGVTAMYAEGESPAAGPISVTIYSCGDPTNLAVSAITTNRATFTWVKSIYSASTNWIVEYGPSGFAHGSGVSVPVSGLPTLTVNTLSPGMTYDVYVMTDCGSGDLSQWTGPQTFITTFACPISAIAEAEVCGTDANGGCNMATPAWEPIACGDSICGTAWCDGTTRDTDWYTFTLLTPTNVTFGGTAEFGFLIGLIDGNLGCPVTSFMVSNTGAANEYKTVSIALGAGTYYAFMAPSSFSTVITCGTLSSYWIALTCNTTCVLPMALGAINITTTSADLVWSSTEPLKNIEWGPGVFAQGAGANLVTGWAANLLTIPTSASSIYTFYVQNTCNGSVWAGPYTFATPCGTVGLPFTEDFTTQTVGVIPNCWTASGLGLTNWTTYAGTYAGGVSPELRFYWTPSFVGASDLLSPIINTTGKTTLNLSFKHFVDYYGAGVFVSVLTTSDGGTTWNTVWTISPVANVGPETINLVISNTDVGSATFQFAFEFNGDSFDIDDWYIDDINLYAPLPPTKTLNLTSIFLEGLYAGEGLMLQAMGDGFVPEWTDGSADHITVELHNALAYGTVELAVPDVPLTTTGTATVVVAASYGDSYYITVKHRNSIETTSADPVSFAGTTIDYAFDLLTKVYGGNMGLEGDGYFVIYAGDENQDGIVDGSDLNDIGNQNDVFAVGYLVEDINGDGLVDGSDLNVTGNNNDTFVARIIPF